MNKQVLDQMWDQTRQKYGVYLRLLEMFPEESYQTHPIPGMRTPAELVAHVSGTVVRDLAAGVARGAVTTDESLEAGTAAGFRTRPALLAFARECWNEADASVAGIGDAQLNAMVTTPWNMTFPGWVGFHMMSDEFLHHRGQLYAFARLSGVEPPFIWGFKENGPGFQPSH